MDPSPSPLTLPPPPPNPKPQPQKKPDHLVFDPSHIIHNPHLPPQFIWPHQDLPDTSDSLTDPPVDLAGFLHGHHSATLSAAAQIGAACSKHGFFHVINHGVHVDVIRAAHERMDAFFQLPVSRKVAAKRERGGMCGYSGAHADRFSSKLPWKETLSFGYLHSAVAPPLHVVEYVKCVVGEDFEEAGYIFQKYCEEMERLAMAILELFAISLGVDRLEYRKFFEDGSSVMRGNNYPACKEAGLTLGTGPHSDPNSITILHQDQVGGLEIFSDNKWRAVPPRPDAFVVNVGDTFMALSNGRYKSCIHRAVVNKESVRRSLVFFVNPKDDKIVRPIQLIKDPITRQYPDFTWSDLRQFTQNHYRADTATLQHFVQWLSLQRHKTTTQLP